MSIVLRVPRTNLVAILIASLSVGMLNFHGLLNFALNASYAPGQFNPILAPLYLTVLALVWANSTLRDWSHEPGRMRIHSTLVPAVLLLLIAMTTSIPHADPVALSRDLIYVLFFALFIGLLQQIDRTNGLDLNALAKYIATLYIFALPPIAFVAGFGFDNWGRFSAFVGSNPIFSIGLCLVCALVLISGLPAAWKIPCVIASLFLAIISGTRTSVGLLIAVISFYLVFDYRKREHTTSTIIIVVISLTGWFFLDSIFKDIFTNSELRVLSLSDTEYGSVATRTSWYNDLLSSLRTTAFFGGFGAGSAESLVGVIPHSDLLRFWHDYSVLFVILFLIMIYFSSKARKLSAVRHPIRRLSSTAFALMIVVFIQFHNVFQTPDALGLLAIFMYFSSYTPTNHQS